MRWVDDEGQRVCLLLPPPPHYTMCVCACVLMTQPGSSAA